MLGNVRRPGGRQGCLCGVLRSPERGARGPHSSLLCIAPGRPRGRIQESLQHLALLVRGLELGVGPGMDVRSQGSGPASCKRGGKKNGQIPGRFVGLTETPHH